MKPVTEPAALDLRALLDHGATEKHIGYHILPERFDACLSDPARRNRYTFFERERWAWFAEHVDFRDRTVLDIGCNIGYFLFSALDAGARRVVGHEGKASCGEFVRAAVAAAGEEDRFEFHNAYFDFATPPPPVGIVLLLNVVHHLGDDYGDPQLGIAAARRGMLEQVNRLATSAQTMIFQMGFNWQGNRHACLFEHGTKREMIDFIRTGTAGAWQVEHVGIAQRIDGRVDYQPLDNQNIERDDALGEFLNRPLFVLRSQRAGGAG